MAAAARGGGPGRQNAQPGHDTSGQALDVTQARLLDSSAALEDGKGALALRGRDSQIDRDLALIERKLIEEGLEDRMAGEDGQDGGPAGPGGRSAKKKGKKKRKVRAGAKTALQGDGAAGSGMLGRDGPPPQSRTALGAPRDDVAAGLREAYGANGLPEDGRASGAASSEAAQPNLGG